MKKYLLLLCIPLFLIGCEDEDVNNYAKARHCLDKATPGLSGDAEACVSSFANDNSQRANKLKCAAKYIAQNFTTTELANIFSNIQNNGNTAFNQTAANLAFQGTGASAALKRDNAKDLATEAFNYCQNSGSVGMAMFASLSYSSTLLAHTLGAGWDGESVPTLDGLGLANDTAIGASIGVIESTYCALESAEVEFCNQIDTIISNAGGPGASNNALGAALRTYIDNG